MKSIVAAIVVLIAICMETPLYAIKHEEGNSMQNSTLSTSNNANLTATNWGGYSPDYQSITTNNSSETDGIKDAAPSRIAVKTNLLYDAILIPNLGIDYEFIPGWSIAANGMYARWSKASSHRYWHINGADIELRKWWHSADGNHRPYLTGHHVGLYFQAGSYDIGTGSRGYVSSGPTFNAGATYGYSLSVSNHFNIDFSLSVGYLWGKYKKYVPQDGCYVWMRTSNRRWVGPTRAEISLVYFIGGKNFRKGGER